jgi:hypothetical protein
MIALRRVNIFTTHPPGWPPHDARRGGWHCRCRSGRCW